MNPPHDKNFCEKCPAHSGLVVRIDGVEKSIEVARAELERRLEAMNEFRAQLDKQSRNFITKVEVDLMLSVINGKLENLSCSSAERAGASKWSDHIITALIGAAVVVLVYLITGK